MKSLPYVEDYLVELTGEDYSFYFGGWTSLLVPKKVNAKISAATPPITYSGNSYNLASYDVKIIRRMADASIPHQLGLTDRQAALALKLIGNYRRQLAKNGIDVEPILSNPQYRKPIRQLNRAKTLNLVDGAIHLRFPYDQDLIEEVRVFAKDSCGDCKWDLDQKIWVVAVTEYNVNYLVTWAKNQNFDVDPKLLDLYEKILLVENQPYEIKLISTDQGYEITNASSSLLDYVATHAGQDLAKLIDLSGVLGYTVSDDVAVAAAELYGVDFVVYGLEQKIQLPCSQEYYKSLLNYCKLANRYPIYVFNPGEVIPIFQEATDLDVVEFDHNGKTTASEEELSCAKLIYVRHLPILDKDFRIPMLVSTVEMMRGGRKLEWCNKAERIVILSNSKLIPKK